MNVDFTITELFKKNLAALKDENVALVVNRGGLRSSKTITILQVLTLYCIKHPGTEVVMMSSSMPKIKQSLHKDWRKIVMNGIYEKVGKMNKTDMLYTFNNGSQIQFLSGEKPEEEYRGITSDFAFLDEINNIKKGVFDEIADRCKDTVFCSFNPSAEFYITEEVMNRDDVIEFVSTFKDNPFISDKQKRRWIKKGQRDPNYQRVMINGEYGTLDGLIFIEDVNWHIVPKLPEMEEEVDGKKVKICDKELHAIDWGFTNDPSIYIKTRFIGDNIYVQECFYKTNMLNRDIAKEIKGFNPNNIKIIADNAEPKSIAELKRTYGIHIEGVNKPHILPSIDLLKSKQLFITEDSLNAIQELRYYQWSEKKKDKKGRTIPEDNWNHIIDGIRYAASTHYGKPKESITFIDL